MPEERGPGSERWDDTRRRNADRRNADRRDAGRWDDAQLWDDPRRWDDTQSPLIRPELPDDALNPGRRGLPRWAIGALWAVVVAIAVTVVVTRPGSAPNGAAPKPGLTSAAPVFSSPVSDDLAITGHTLFRLSHAALYRLDVTVPRSPTPDGVSAVNGLDLTLSGATFRLVLDAPAHHIWVITYGASPATLVEFDTRTLREIGQLLWPSEVFGAAALQGHLYLASVNAVVDVASPNAPPSTIGALTGQYTAIAADPTRSRLVLGGGNYLQTYTPGTAAASGPVHQSFTKISLQVADGAIWAAGFGHSGAVLARLDPSTLRAAGFSALSPQLGAGDLLVDAGTRVLWVRAMGDDDGLWCVDAGSGDELQYWQYAGAVASAPGVAFVAEPDGPLPLRLTTCPG